MKEIFPMRFSFTIRNLLTLLSLLFLLNNCKKPDSSNNPPVNLPPAVTPVGTPVGNAVNKMIGSTGGSIASPDGRVELNFPAGALSSNTNISIQPVTNQAPGGIGLSYHLMPDGITFAKPVTLKYRYTDVEINGTLPYLLYIAYQDSLRQWKADFKNRNVDTTAKTVSADISHFSIWSMGERLIIYADPSALTENETSALKVFLQSPPEQTSGSGDDLPPLPSTTLLSDNAVSNWKVNGRTGNNQDGTITGTGSNVTYKAPSPIDRERTVQVSAELNYSIVVYNNGKAVSSVNKLILFTTISLLPSKFEYTVETQYVDSAVTGYKGGQTYLDKASFDISFKKIKNIMGIPMIVVSASNFLNYVPSVSPSSKTYIDGITWSWIPDGIGLTNITAVKFLNGLTLSDSTVFFDGDSIVRIEFLHTGALNPGFNWQTAANSGTVPTMPLGGTAGLPDGVDMKLTRRDQSYPDVGVKIKAK